MYRLADFRMSYATRLRLGLGLSVVGIASQNILADQTWDNGAGNQDWNNVTNWTNDTFPTGTNAIVNTATAGAFPIISATPTSGTPTDIKIGTGASQTGRIDQTGGTAGTGAGNWIFIGQDGGTGTFNLSGGSFSAGRINIGAWSSPSNSNGTLNMTGGTLTANNGGDRVFDIGENGNTGLLNVDDGIVNATGAIWLGTGTASSQGTLDLSGGTINAGGLVRMGEGGTGNLNISGGLFNQTAGEFWVGTSGTSTVTQSGGNLNTPTYFVIGRGIGSNTVAGGGSGTYNLSGGTVDAATTGGVTTLASTRGATGALSVSGTGTFNTNNGLLVGEAYFTGNNTGTATATLTIADTGLLSTGTNLTNGVFLAVNANTTGTVNLNGGTLQTALVKQGAGTGTFNFDGGTLKATAGSATFMQGLTAANVLDGGAVVDSNGFNITVGQALLDGGGNGGLNKNGSGTLVLTGANTYTGATNVVGGTLDVNGTLTSNIVVGSSAVVTGTGSTTGSLTFNAGSTLSASTSGPLVVNGVNFAGATGLTLEGIPINGETYVLVDFGAGTVQNLGNLASLRNAPFVDGTQVKLTMATANLTWNTTNGTWINGGTGWTGAANYYNGDSVTFGERPAASVVTLSGSLVPGGIVVSNTADPYTFSGSGFISGATTLTKDGAGALTIATANTYSGATTLNAGTLNISHASALGTGSLTINGGTFDNTSGSALVMTGDIAQFWDADVIFTGTHSLDMGLGAVAIGGLGTDRTVTVSANTLAVGEITASFRGLIKQGAGTLEVGSTGIGFGASTVSGALNVAAGTLQFNRTGSSGDASGDFTSAGVTGSGTLSNGATVARWYFTNPASGTFDFAGTLANGGAGALGFYKSGDGVQILSGANSYTDRTSVAGGELVISGANSGTGTYTEVISGKLTLASTQALGTTALIRFFGDSVSTLDLATDTDGTAYAIAQGTTTNSAIISNRATPGAGINHTLTTETLANGLGGGTITFTSGANVTSGTGRITFTQFGLGAGSVQTTTLNPTTANVTLGDVAKQNNNVSQTLGLGGTSTDNHVTGVIANGPPLTGGNNVSVLKTGTSTWTLSGANTYTGTTTVDGGILSISQDDVLADSASVSVATAGVLNLSHGGTDIVDRFFINGVEQIAGTWGSLTSSATNKTARITGTGILQATNGAAAGGYSGWSTFFSLSGGASADQELDGFQNGTEYILGGSPVSGSNNPKIYSLIADGSVDGDSTNELIMTIAVPVGTPAFSAGAPTSTATFEGFGIEVRGSTTLSSFPVVVTPVAPTITGLPTAPVQGGITYEYRSFSLGGSNGLTGKGFFQVVVTNP